MLVIEPKVEFLWITSPPNLSAEVNLALERMLAYKIICTHEVAFQLQQLRILSCVREEPRYFDSKEPTQLVVVEPPLSELTLLHWEHAMQEAERIYLKLLEEGASHELAKLVLPMSSCTELMAIGTLREWRKLLRQELALEAPSLLQQVLHKLAQDAKDRVPLIFDEFYGK